MAAVQDSFYKRNSPEEVALAHANRKDFDHPDAIDMPLFAEVILPQSRMLKISHLCISALPT